MAVSGELLVWIRCPQGVTPRIHKISIHSQSTHLIGSEEYKGGYLAVENSIFQLTDMLLSFNFISKFHCTTHANLQLKIWHLT